MTDITPSTGRAETTGDDTLSAFFNNADNAAAVRLDRWIALCESSGLNTLARALENMPERGQGDDYEVLSSTGPVGAARPYGIQKSTEIVHVGGSPETLTSFSISLNDAGKINYECRSGCHKGPGEFEEKQIIPLTEASSLEEIIKGPLAKWIGETAPDFLQELQQKVAEIKQAATAPAPRPFTPQLRGH